MYENLQLMPFLFLMPEGVFLEISMLCNPTDKQ